VNKTTYLAILLVVMNSSDLLSLIFKNISIYPPVGYLFTVMISFFIIMSYHRNYIISKKLYNILVFVNIYLILKLAQGLIYADEYVYPFLVFFIFNITIYIYIMFDEFSESELNLLLKKMIYYSILIYFFFDFINLIVLGKGSLLVVLQNNFTTWILAITVFVVTTNTKKEIPKMIIVLLLLCFWLYFSHTYDITSRIQMKIVGLLSILILILFAVYPFKRFFSKFNSRFSVRFMIPLIVLFGIFFVAILAVYSYNNFLEFNMLRSVSYDKRLLITEAMFTDVNKNIFNTLFGFGIGSSIKPFYVIFDGLTLRYTSHSGFVSFYYEHGVISIIFFMYLCFIIFTNKKILVFKKEISRLFYGKLNRGIILLLLLVLLFNWIYLNVTYLFAMPIADFYHNTQIILYILLVIIVKKLLFIPSLRHKLKR
jgi:hypothetical protein